MSKKAKRKEDKAKKTYNTRDSLVVTDPTTSLALTGQAYLWESGRDPEFSSGYGRM